MTRGERWLAAVRAAERVIDNPEEGETLNVMAAALDRMDEARRAIDEHGLLIEGLPGHGSKVNPAEKVLRDAEAVWMRGARLVKLHDWPEHDWPEGGR
jgi:transposase